MALGIQISQVVIEFVVPQAAPGPTPTPVCNNPPDGTVGVFYSHSFGVSGGTAPYTWAIISGAVPGLALDPSTGIISGTPTTGGTFPITVQVTDSLAAVGTVDCSITINAAPPPPTPSCNNPPNGTVETVYSHTFTVSGGLAPYTWALSAGAVPGLALDPGTGIISGVPTTAGTFPISVQVTDSLSQVGTVDCSITIGPAITTGSIRITLRGVKLRPVCETGEPEIGQVPQIPKVDRAL